MVRCYRKPGNGLGLLPEEDDRMGDREDAKRAPKVVMLSQEEIRFLDDAELEEVLGGQTGPASGSCAGCTSGTQITCCGTDNGGGGGGGAGGGDTSKCQQY
jgi:hypothetical protein